MMNFLEKHRMGLMVGVFMFLEAVSILFVDRPVALAAKQLDTAHPEIINFFRAITDIGLGKWYEWPSGIGALVCLGLYRLPHVNEAARRHILKWGGILVFFFVSTAAAGVATDILKGLFGRARPKLFFTENLYGFHPLMLKSGWTAMPSGHATTIVAVAVALTILFPRARYPAALMAFMVALSRIMVNAHFLSDVLAGGLVGVIVTLLLARWFAGKGLLTRADRDKVGLQNGQPFA